MGTLTERLDAIRADGADRIPAPALAEMHRATAELRDSGLHEGAKGVGDVAPPVALENSRGEIPARYVIAGDGTIRYAAVDPDDTRRPEPAETTAVVRGLSG